MVTSDESRAAGSVEAAGSTEPPATEAHEEREVRRGKRDRLRDAGFDPYPPRVARTHACAVARTLFHEDGPSERVSVVGRVKALRDHGKTWFAVIEDESGVIQIYLKKDLLGEAFSLVKLLDLGDFIGATGEIFKTRMGEITVRADELGVLSKAIEPPPAKWHGLADVEIRYRRRYLDLVANPEVRDVFRARSLIVRALRDFLAGRGFMEVETPMMQPLAGGAAARPFITHHNTLDVDLFLRIAPELYLKRLVVGGFERVYELNRNFRNEGMDRNHNPEFTMLEAYQAYADYHDMMELTESMVHAAAEAFLAAESLRPRSVPGHEATESAVSSPPVLPPPPWPRVSFFDAIEQGGGPRLSPGDAAGAAAALGALNASREEQPDRHGTEVDLNSEAACLEALFDRFAEPQLEGPIFVIDYPTILSPLAKKKPGTPELVERFELYIRGMEIANAFSELNDPDDQEERFRAQGGPVDEDYVHALRAGMPPAGGMGIGIDRLVMILTGARTIRDVILFPAMRPEV